MDFLLNDRSLHAQFHDLPSFRSSLDAVMTLRAAVEREGRAVACHRALLEARLTSGKTLRQVVAALPRAQQSALLAWITKHGPFWEDLRQHGPDDWLEWRGDIVTDTALGEAAFANRRGADRHLLSFCPSDFAHHPIVVDWRRGEELLPVSVPNYWELASLQRALAAAPAPLATWAALEDRARARFDELTLTRDAFAPLAGHPFVPAAADRLLFILGTLDRLRRCFSTDGSRTTEGHQIYQDFFTGKKVAGGRGAMFSDSSDSEKADFASELRFPHPDIPGETLCCPWHGKVQTPPFRVHFSYPIRADEPLYVVYVGPKLTKR